MKNVLVKNGLVVTARKSFPADILISDGLINVVGPDLSPPPETEVIDASGLWVLPGGVDVHTHLDLAVGQAHVSDGWFAGTMAAAYGGTTTVVEHPGFGPDGCPLDYQLNIYRQNAVEAAVDYGLHGVFQHWNGAAARRCRELAAAGYPSFKAYMTYDGRLNEGDLLAAMKVLGEAGGLMTVHAENHAIVNFLADELKVSAPGRAASHPQSRPGYAEALAVHTAVCLAKAAGPAPLYIVHLSTAEGLEAVRAAKRAGLPVWAETCPQYLVLTDRKYEGDFDQALKFVMAPPLRSERDVEALWEGLADGSIDVVATDHCSFSWRDKRARAGGSVFKCPGGAPGVETRLALIHSEGVVKRGLSPERWVEVCATAPARIMGLTEKGRLEVGLSADLTLFDPRREKKLTADTLHQAVDYTPFEYLTVRGWPKIVLLRGQKIIDGDRFLGRPGQGRFIERSLNHGG